MQSAARQKLNIANADRRRRRKPRKPSGDWIAIGTLIGNLIIGCAATALAYAGIMLTREFNAWQRDQASKETCLQLVALGTSIAKELGETQARAALQKVTQTTQDCLSVRIDVEKLSAAVIVKHADQFPPALVARAAAIVLPEKVRKRSESEADAKAVREKADEIYSDALGGRMHPIDNAVTSLNIPQRDFRPADPGRDGVNYTRPGQAQDVTERFTVPEGESTSPRVRIGTGVSWNSPFGPVSFDIAKDLAEQSAQDSKKVAFDTERQF